MIYFIRHGQTDYNLNGRVQGRANISLNENGIAQAKNLKSKLQNINFDIVYCSPLNRARETLDILEIPAPVIFDERIIERDYGEFEGAYTNVFNHSDFWNSNKNQKFKKAESLNEIIKRVYSFLDEVKTQKDKNVLLVCHGGVGMIIKSYFNGNPKNGDYFSYKPENAEIITYKYK